MITDAHGYKTPRDGVTGGSRVAVPDQVGRCIIPGKGIGDLMGDPFGCGMPVTLSDISRRRWCLRITKTKSSLKPTVGTTRKSMAAIPAAWLRRKAFQVCDDPPPLLAMYLATVDCATSIPSLSNSPSMRGAPTKSSAGLISSDQAADLSRNLRTTAPSARFPAPIQAEARSMPSEVRLGLDDDGNVNSDGTSRYSQTRSRRSATVHLGFAGMRRRSTFGLMPQEDNLASSRA